MAGWIDGHMGRQIGTRKADHTQQQRRYRRYTLRETRKEPVGKAQLIHSTNQPTNQVTNNRPIGKKMHGHGNHVIVRGMG
mmetsp:Transcript_45785/g.113771  ORF Transcript_45785/g.113771 Transcript_45785/m.113771 type:complete len:80 (+) Transcript_45785:704-943(+)